MFEKMNYTTYEIKSQLRGIRSMGGERCRERVGHFGEQKQKNLVRNVFDEVLN